jgi:hypothetical protein
MLTESDVKEMSLLLYRIYFGKVDSVCKAGICNCVFGFDNLARSLPG